MDKVRKVVRVADWDGKGELRVEVWITTEWDNPNKPIYTTYLTPSDFVAHVRSQLGVEPFELIARPLKKEAKPDETNPCS